MNRQTTFIAASGGVILAAVVGAVAVARIQPHHVLQPTIAQPAAALVATRHVAINVSGMYCESCEATVKAMLNRTAGVISAKVDVAKGLATVSYDAATTNPAKLAAVINALGYKATVPPAEANGNPGSA